MITDSFYPDGLGGVHTYVYNLCRGLVEKGNKVAVICPNFDLKFKKEEVIEGIEVFRYKSVSKGKLFFLKRPLYNLLAYFCCRKLLKRGYDVINFHSCLPALPYNMMLKHPAKLNVYTFHASMFHEVFLQSKKKKYSRIIPVGFILKVLHAIENINLKHADRIIVLSEFNKSEIMKHFSDIDESKINIIPGGVDIYSFKPVGGRSEKGLIREKLKLPQKAFILFTIRRLVARMGLENLIIAFKRLKTIFGDIYLVIGGDGFLRDRLDSEIAGYQLEKDILLTGKIKNEELPLYYQASDLFILPTEHLEGFGLVSLEAMASGLCVLGTPVGGTVEILKELGNEFLFEGNSPDDIANGIEEFIKKDYDIVELGRKCRDYVAKKYSWENIVSRINAHYQEWLK
ncbi:MAG: glycosyltransferase family 4 protein [bacterium]|nr:glycosyltransferase family 4 protein [bacterium]